MSHRPTVDFWLEYASSYSYPAAERIGRLAGQAGVAVRWRPFLLGPIFAAQGWSTSPFNLYPHKGRYMWRDLERVCEKLAIPFRRLEQFPQNSLLAARVALIGFDEGWGEAFSRAVYRAEFAEGRNIGEVLVICALLDRLSLNAGGVIARAQSAPIKERLRGQTEEAQRIGLFGAPAFVTADGEIFWGNDRLEDALAWARR